jgi:anthranilate synthase component 1
LYLDVIVYDHAADTITYVSRGEDRSAIVRAALARPRPAAPPAASGALDASAALEVSAPREASPALDASVPSEPDAAGPRGPPPGPAARLQVGRLAISADDDAFATSVRAAQELIRAGECFQVVLSRAFTGRFAGELGPLYAWLRDAAAVPYLYYLRFAPLARAAAVGPAGPAGQPLVLMGASPEMLVRVRHGQCETFPIAGTRPVTGHDDEDDDAADDLRHDRKECAEHAMLVDLARNDLSRVCTPGTVRVDGYQTVQRFRDVQHLVTRVTGTLGAGRDALDALAAVFPAGTVSGAPKVRAMEHIARLERRPRGPYAGAVAYVSFNGDLDSAIAIRSLSAVGDRLTVQAGAGIVNASEADAEARETLHKARTLLDGLQHFGATLPAQAERPRAPGAPPTRRAAASTVEAQR